uniref:Inositol polyphosphate-1-phosphatase n=1 Tax=Ursus americanus TaxID=9643 RepID=A0A452Q915_URSAM
MSDILRELLHVSEKAANIARACRQQEALFQLLIEEKKDGEKNKKFAVDFKTLADVLVQEVIKQNMENKVRKVTAKVIAKYLPCGFFSSRKLWAGAVLKTENPHLF